MWKRKMELLCIFIILWLASTQNVEAGRDFLSNYIQYVYDEESEIPVTSANYILQTSDKYMWIASYDGLYRFDGKTAELIDEKKDQFPSEKINTLYEDTKGNLWIGTNDAGVVLYRENEYIIFDTEKGLPANSIRSIDEDREGNIYLATSGGVISIGSDLTVNDTVSELSGILALDLVCIENGEIWCVTNDGDVSVIRENKVIDTFQPKTTPAFAATCIFEDLGGGIYIGGNDNQIIYIENIAEKEEYTVIEAHNISQITSFYEDAAKKIWLCSSSGFGYIENGVFEYIEGSQIDVSLSNITQDYEGNYWITSTRRGLACFVPSKFHNINFNGSLPEMTVNTTIKYDENTYIGSDQGLYIVNEFGESVQNDLTKMLTNIRIRCIKNDNNGNIWICTYAKYGVIRYRQDENEIVSINSQNSDLPNDNTRFAAETADGRIVVGTNEGISIIEGDIVTKNYTTKDGIENPYILSFTEDSDGTFYLGSDGSGIYKIQEDHITNYSEKDGLPSGVILRMAYDKTYDGIWVSSGNKMDFFKDGNFQKISIFNDPSVFDIKLIDDDKMLAATSKGLYFLSRSELLEGTQTDEPIILSKGDGLLSAITANSWNHYSEDGLLYLSCNKGAFSIDTENYYVNEIVPAVAISSIVIDEEVYPHTEDITIPKDATRITIQFSLLTQHQNDGSSLSYQLKGFDQAPIVLSKESELKASYTNLKGGNYDFILKGINGDQMESEEFQIHIRKELKLTERIITWVIAVILLILLIGTITHTYNKRRTRQLLKRQEAYRLITDQAITTIADTIDAKDEYTAGHSRRVAEYSRKIGMRLGLEKEQIENLYYIALLHDIGKIGIPDHILNKKGKLDDDEYTEIKRHVDIGGTILSNMTVIEDIVVGARYHHERYDGTGYPDRLSGENIPLTARIICVADSFDAMYSTRSYRKALDLDYIVRELEQCAGTQFDKKVVDELVNIIKEEGEKVSNFV